MYLNSQTRGSSVHTTDQLSTMFLFLCVFFLLNRDLPKLPRLFSSKAHFWQCHANKTNNQILLHILCNRVPVSVLKKISHKTLFGKDSGRLSFDWDTQLFELKCPKSQHAISPVGVFDIDVK